MRKLKLEELGRIDVPEFKARTKIPVIVVLDNIRSGLNVGSVFRSSDAFALSKVYLCGITPVPPHKEILKSAIGATEAVTWGYEKHTTEVLAQLKAQGYQIIGIEQTTNSTGLESYDIDIERNYVIVMGNEVEGISEDCLPLLDDVVDLPQYGTKHSLNVSVCAGIVFWEFMKVFQQRL